MKPILDEKFVILKTKVSQSIQDLLSLTDQIGHAALSDTIREIQHRVEEPYMFVIVGEVKAGKSSFINALLDTGRDICKVAPSPMTDTIQQILYGEPAREEIINPYLKKLYQPEEILREIAIVDTPGTNTIVEHHQEITERFIPGSDLIVFVFEAKNPYRQSSWEFFDYIHSEWRKKIIFVLQQKDLMPAEDLAINLKGVTDQAIKKGVENPTVFAVSAKQEQEGDKQNSGFVPLRTYIQLNITGGQAPVLKLQSNTNTAINVAEKIRQGLDLREKQFELDKAFRTDISNTLNKQTQVSHDQVNVLVENLLANYDTIMRSKTDELNSVLSFGSVFRRSISSIFSKKQSLKEWLTNFSGGLEEDLNKGLRDKLNERVLDLAESIQQMGQIIDLKIRSSETILKDDHEIFSEIAERRTNVLKDLKDAFSSFLQNTDNFTDEALFSEKEKMSPTLATGSGIALVGVILATVMQGMVFDITGGVLTAVGFVFAGVSLGLQKRKIMRNFKEEIAKGRTKLEEDVKKKLRNYVDYIKDRIDSNFSKFDALLESEETALSQLSTDHRKVDETLRGILGEIE